MNKALEHLSDEQLAREAERIGEIGPEMAGGLPVAVQKLANVVADHIRRKAEDDKEPDSKGD